MGKTESLKVENWQISKLIPYARNPRINDAAVPKLAGLIQEFGFKVPLVIRSDGTIIDGHERYKAAQMLGLETVPVTIADEWTDAQVKAFRLAVNRSAEWAQWDAELLSLELSDLKELDFDLGKIDFEVGDIDALMGEQSEGRGGCTDPDEVPDVQGKLVTQVGDIWLLGKHRLMCGDSTDAGNVALLMNGEKADMVFTDPPYGMKKESDGVLNDNLNFDDLLEFNKKWIPVSFENLKSNGSWYCWGIDEPLMNIYSEILKPMQRENKITFRNLLTWNKGVGQGQNSPEFRMYPIADEKCLFVMCGVQGFSNNADNYFEAWEPIRLYLKQERDRMGWTNSDMKKMCGHSPTSGCHWFDKSQWVMPTEEEYKIWQKNAKNEGFKKEYEEIKKEYYSTRAYFNNIHDNQNNVWHFERAGKEERVGHATPKPIDLCVRAIKTSSREKESVLDLFGGSGSTLIACEKTGRVCRMMELSPHYCDVIIKRWQDFTGECAKLEADGRTFEEIEDGKEARAR